MLKMLLNNMIGLREDSRAMAYGDYIKYRKSSKQTLPFHFHFYHAKTSFLISI
jgi:hypothetical protein